MEYPNPVWRIPKTPPLRNVGVVAYGLRRIEHTFEQSLGEPLQHSTIEAMTICELGDVAASAGLRASSLLDEYEPQCAASTHER
jgi:hypothetical protein